MLSNGDSNSNSNSDGTSNSTTTTTTTTTTTSSPTSTSDSDSNSNSETMAHFQPPEEREARKAGNWVGHFFPSAVLGTKSNKLAAIRATNYTQQTTIDTRLA